MKFIPNSHIKKELLKEVNLENVDALFSDIPKEIRIDGLNLEDGLSQQEIERKMRKIANKNKSCNELTCFIGGGIKPHYIPSVVNSFISRAEFFTAYTPYQSEASQGFLQSMFEYQSMIAEITGLDVANCSLYDGVTALSEAALMSSRVNRKKEFVIPENISRDKKSVLKNYLKGPGIKITEVSYDRESGKIDINDLKKKVNSDVSGVYIENPNFFGIFEDDVDKINKIVKDAGSLFIVGIDPISMGIVKSPGEYGADIVIGEGSSLGLPMDFGGSTLGIFSCKKDFLRKMPGRIIGLTKDSDCKKAFCMALQTREQHIRRGRATSNICTNEGLCALAACVYLSWLGGKNLSSISKINFERAHTLFEKICSIEGFQPVFRGDYFNEFVIECPDSPNMINNKLLKDNIQGGLPIEEGFSDLKNCMLFGATEVHSEEDIDRLIDSLKEV